MMDSYGYCALLFHAGVICDWLFCGESITEVVDGDIVPAYISVSTLPYRAVYECTCNTSKA